MMMTFLNTHCDGAARGRGLVLVADGQAELAAALAREVRLQPDTRPEPHSASEASVQITRAHPTRSVPTPEQRRADRAGRFEDGSAAWQAWVRALPHAPRLFEDVDVSRVVGGGEERACALGARHPGHGSDARGLSDALGSHCGRNHGLGWVARGLEVGPQRHEQHCGANGRGARQRLRREGEGQRARAVVVRERGGAHRDVGGTLPGEQRDGLEYCLEYCAEPGCMLYLRQCGRRRGQSGSIGGHSRFRPTCAVSQAH
jgi:hypothetical protein